MSSTWLSWGRRYRYPAVALLALMTLGGASRFPTENGHVAAAPRPAVDHRSDDPLFTAVHINPMVDLPPVSGAGILPLTPGWAGIPVTVLAAYQRAADSVAQTDPSCHLTWPVLAAIGKVESNNADNGDVNAQGDVLRPIFGPVLDGQDGTAAIPASDQSGQSGTWARAEGPMQFLPSTWAKWATTASGDGTPNVQNVNDAALAAAHYLCAGNVDLANGDDLSEAILRYNPSPYYLDTVTYWLRVYDNGVSPVPDMPGTAESPAQTFLADAPDSSTVSPSRTDPPPANSGGSAPKPSGPAAPPNPRPAPPAPDNPGTKQLLHPVTRLVDTVTTPLLGDLLS